jgi:hypothetical protein
LKANSKSTAPKNIIGFHDMFIVYQIIQSSSTLTDFVQLCQEKLEKSSEHVSLVEQYNQYLKRCGLTDLIDLWEECQLRSTMKMLVVTSDHVKTELDRLFLENLLQSASVDDQTAKKFLQQEKKPLEQTISKVTIRVDLSKSYLLSSNRITSNILCTRISPYCWIRAMNMPWSIV